MDSHGKKQATCVFVGKTEHKPEQPERYRRGEIRMSEGEDAGTQDKRHPGRGVILKISLEEAPEEKLSKRLLFCKRLQRKVDATADPISKLRRIKEGVCISLTGSF